MTAHSLNTPGWPVSAICTIRGHGHFLRMPPSPGRTNCLNSIHDYYVPQEVKHGVCCTPKEASFIPLQYVSERTDLDYLPRQVEHGPCCTAKEAPQSCWSSLYYRCIIHAYLLSGLSLLCLQGPLLLLKSHPLLLRFLYIFYQREAKNDFTSIVYCCCSPQSFEIPSRVSTCCGNSDPDTDLSVS